ncbi:hypothetical protein FRC11_002683 [Ceratobasidium sp. 423]|nr:hypothetical protein FRC11_002683 [Ceratobasidium sp. 423]
MTRYTNTGRKRTYLEAGFGEKYASESPEPEALEAEEEPQAKRKRGDKKVKRVKEAAKESVYFGGEHTGGADEDDFHALRRRNADIDKEERTEQYLARTVKREARAAPTPSLVNGVTVKRPTTKPKVVAF